MKFAHMRNQYLSVFDALLVGSMSIMIKQQFPAFLASTTNIITQSVINANADSSNPISMGLTARNALNTRSTKKMKKSVPSVRQINNFLTRKPEVVKDALKKLQSAI